MPNQGSQSAGGITREDLERLREDLKKYFNERLQKVETSLNATRYEFSLLTQRLELGAPTVLSPGVQATIGIEGFDIG